MPGANELPSYRCGRIAAAFEVDGELSKPAWLSAPVIELNLAETAGKPVQSTFVRGCWDGENLYLSFDCQDQDIRATFTRRDDKVWLEEAVEAFIAPEGDLIHYYEFQCSPLNVVRDLKVTNPNARQEDAIFDGVWDCAGWKTAVKRVSKAGDPDGGSLGWRAEWRVPLSELLHPGAKPVRSGDEWRINLFRIDRWPRQEFSSWSATPGHPFSFHRPDYFGRWIFE